MLKCGSPFLWYSSRPNQVYCSTKCRMSAIEDGKKRGYTEERKCLFCGKTYTWSSQKPGTKYCSSDCQKKANEKNIQKYKQKKKKKLEDTIDIQVSIIVTDLINKSRSPGKSVNGIELDYRLLGDISEKTREIVLDRDNHQCRVCGAKNPLHIHHIIKRRYGGDHSAENLITLCASCHRTIETGNLEYAIKKCSRNAHQNKQSGDRKEHEDKKALLGHSIYILENLFSSFSQEYPDESEYLVKIDKIIEMLETIQESYLF